MTNNAEARWREWHDKRNEELASSHGWLSLISFTWLSEERSGISSFPGSWYADRGEAAVSFKDVEHAYALPVYKDGEKFTGEAVYDLAEGESQTNLEAGTRVAEVARRGGKYAVRVRDSLAPTLKAFTGVPTFDYDPNAVVSGRFVPYPEPRVVPIETARSSVTSETTLVGDVVFSIDDDEFSLAVSRSGSGDLIAVFHDASNGEETADWRFVSVPGDDVVVDFNKALNFPAAFTPFGTCPKPPEGNTLGVKILAGEKRPAEWIDPHSQSSL
ncbi:DUF1684 domain-containing protein [Ancrocorticia populi]|uniref:DUF1684 domain-containing protein n=1 Tax=Ancrocorticia populi TaxID=2175228 RepID=A0A2V1K9M8_9ACTO|nr:DUF1684 domain-containing protein [Ancrocorticia populi]MDN6487432.1 DUF1684 domain-containing protein [Ancrocorticia sp.]PWF27010.1 DUF1684 domain-containing protein [Ancrocorticia populi]